MSIEKITAAEIERTSMEGVANRPNQRTGFGNAGMTPAELKARYSALAMLAINKYNELIEAFGNDVTEGELLSALYTHLADRHDDQKRMSLADWICSVEDAFGHIRTDSGVFHLINTRIKVGNVDPVANFGSYTVAPRSGDVALTTDYDLYHLTVEEIDGTPVITPEFIANIKGLDGKDGANGKDGNDGVSPTVAVAEVEDGYQITVTDVNGDKTFFLPKGAKGDTGAPFAIAKTYASVAAMRAGYATDGVAEGGFVLIVTGSVEDADNAKLYVKGPTAYQYLCDLSGATGIQGPAGSSVKSIKKTGTVGLVDTYTVTLTDGSTSTFTVTNGKDGKDGEDGEDGEDGTDGISPTIDVAESSIGYNVTITDANGSKYLTLKHGKDGEGGGTDPRRNTLLCDAVLGMMHIGEGNFGVYATMPLADTMLPNTEYTVNGTAYTSDADGKITCSLTTSMGESVTVVLSGSTVELLNGESLSQDNASYKNNSVRVTLVGPGAFTCLAQFTGFFGPMSALADSYVYTVESNMQLDPYRVLYVHYGEFVFPIQADANGEVISHRFEPEGGYGDLCLSVKNGIVTLDSAGYYGWREMAKLTVLAESLDVGAAGGGASGGTSSGGGRVARTYYVPYYQSAYFDIPLDSTKIYIVTVEEITYGTPKRIMVLKDGYVERECSGETLYSSVYFMGSTLCISASENSVFVTMEEVDSYEEISCFIEGTPVLLRDPVTYALYEKPIEQVLPFEYAAFWNPAKGRIDATRVLAPPIAGDAEEFDRLYFDNGTELDVYGVQFFWNVDTDTLVDWSKMEQGTRVCTKDGDIVRFVRAEHIVPEVPVKHYTLLTYRGRYIAGGIVAGDKRDLIYPRLMAPERVRYWRMLNETDQNGLIKAHREGCHRRNWKYSRELHDALDPLKRRRRELEGRIGERKQYLVNTDHRVIKFTEGVIDEAAFAPDRTRRAEARTDINRDEVEIVTVDGQIAAETERVRAEIAATWKPKYAGRFVGKNKVILEDEV